MRFKANIRKLMARAGIQLGLYAPWNDRNNKPFYDIMKQVDPRTLVDRVRCYMLYQYSRQVVSLKGDATEVGVYKGGTSRILAGVFEASGKTVHLFDTFEGIPSSDSSKDLHKAKDFADTSFDSVKTYLSDYRNVRLYKGVFPDTAKTLENTSFCMVHIDVDVYQSVKDCCGFFYPRMDKGGVIIFDDYGFKSCPGAKTAVDEFFSDKPENPCYLPTGQCIVTHL